MVNFNKCKDVYKLTLFLRVIFFFLNLINCIKMFFILKSFLCLLTLLRLSQTQFLEGHSSAELKSETHKIIACHTVRHVSNKLGYDVCRLYDDDTY